MIASICFKLHVISFFFDSMPYSKELGGLESLLCDKTSRLMTKVLVAQSENLQVIDGLPHTV